MITADTRWNFDEDAFYTDGPDRLTDAYGNEYAYDAFVKKWVRKRKAKRAVNPRVIARRVRQDERRIKRGKAPKHPQAAPKVSPPKPGPTTTAKPPEQPVPKNPVVSRPVPVPTADKPLTRQEAQVHRNVNKAIQEEQKTRQEELKTAGLEKRVAQEDVKTEKEKAQAGLISAGRGALWIIAIAGCVWVVSGVLGRKEKLDARLSRQA